MSNEYLSCSLCPRACRVDRTKGEVGVCGADNALRITRAALHFWEEPPISGEAGSGTVFFSHCPLHCVYCQNYQISGKEPVGEKISVQELAQRFLELQFADAMNVNLVTPTHYAPQIREAIYVARESGLHLPIIWNTSGYETESAVRANSGFVDIYLTDMKYASSNLAKAFSAAPDYPEVALKALDEMVRHIGSLEYDEYNGQKRLVRGVVVRHMLLPGCLGDSKAVVQILHERYGDKIKLSLMGQYTPVLSTLADRGSARAKAVLEKYPELGRTVLPEEYEELLCFADSTGVEDYFWQEPGTAEESFIPIFTV